MAHPLLEKAAQHTAQARAINDEFSGKSMPAEAAHQMEQHLKAASEYRARVTREAALEDVEQWIAEPQYKHDMSNGATVAEKFGHGKVSTEDEYKEMQEKAFYSYIRKGLDALKPEQKADLVEDATGQNLVPVDFAGTILKELPREATIRNLAFVRPTSKNRVDVGAVAINTAGWGKLETDPTPSPTDGLPGTPASKQTIEVHDLNALVKLGRDELEDSDENLAEIIRGALSLKFAELEDDAFAAGSGTDQPWGLSHNVTQNVTAAAGQTVTPDELKKLTFAVPAQFRKSGRSVFVGHTSVEQAVALLKDLDGHYLLQDKAALGEPPTLFGYRWYTVDGLPSMTTTADAGAGTDKSCLFGDLMAGYMIADRRRLTVVRLEERYAEEGKVGLLFTHRVGGDVIRPKALAYYAL